MVEWFKALVLKTSEVQASVGSNPTLSAMILPRLSGRVFVIGAKWFILNMAIRN